jgi:hypothetical protein
LFLLVEMTSELLKMHKIEPTNVIKLLQEHYGATSAAPTINPKEQELFEHIKGKPCFIFTVVPQFNHYIFLHTTILRHHRQLYYLGRV